MSTETTVERCPICGSDEATPWGEENGFTAVRCGDCHLVYLSPWPDLTERDRALQYGAHEGEHRIDTNARPGSRTYLRDYRRVLAHLYGGELADRRIAWLDIGCGYGEFLSVLKSRTASGSVLRGSEPNERKAAYARSQGLDVEYRELGEYEERFTHISLLNVFSHLPDPVGFLRLATDLLESGGELLLQTGNAGDIERREFPGELWFPDHLVFAGRKTLDLVLEQLGMRAVAAREYPSPAPTPVNLAKDLAKRVVRAGYNPVRWGGPSRTVWLRAVKP